MARECLRTSVKDRFPNFILNIHTESKQDVSRILGWWSASNADGPVSKKDVVFFCSDPVHSTKSANFYNITI